MVVHPGYLFVVLYKQAYSEFAQKASTRYRKTYRYMQSAITRNTMFVAKDKAPFTDAQEQPVYLDPLARVAECKEKKLIFHDKNIQADNYVQKNAHSTAQALSGLNKSSKGVGVDVELLSALNLENETFIERNFTDEEVAYCSKSPSPQASFTGTWSAKEAVFKALGVESKGAGAPLKDIEIVRENGAPRVKLTGEASKAAAKAGVKSVNVSISHDDYQATAVALAEF